MTTITPTILKAARILSNRREIQKQKGGSKRITWARRVIAATTPKA